MALLMIFSFVLYRKFHIWKLVLILILAGIFGVIRLFPQWLSFMPLEDLKFYYEYLLYLCVIVLGITFKRKIRITENLTDYDFFELEKELEETKSNSDLLRMRYISTIGLISEGLIFYNEDANGLFVTDQ
ncbi:MAG: hypothetical protein PHV42_04340, partial [Candidatus Pacebacteria bacterium]|nr:hypothetical protein [Candidatus Paceibacterota bacterium]